MRQLGISVFYYIQNNKLLDEPDITEFDNRLDSIIRILINNGVYINNFQDSIGGLLH